MTALTEVNTKRSWANIVKGETAPMETSPDQVEAPLQPSARGERKCLCHGEILVMLGHYGWIMSLDEIDHPDVRKNGGRIYVHKRDVIEDVVPVVAGDRVVFYLYVDQQGLGAEACQLDEPEPTLLIDDPTFGPSLADSFLPKSESEYQWHPGAEDSIWCVPKDTDTAWTSLTKDLTPSPATTCSMNAGAVEFVPKGAGMNPAAMEFIPEAASMNPGAVEFVPKDSSMNPDAMAFMPRAWCLDTKTLLPGCDTSNPQALPAIQPTAATQSPNVELLAINLAYLSDSSDDGDSVYGDDASSEAESATESEDSWTDASVTKGANQWDAQLDAVVLCAPLKGPGSASKRAASPEGSTSAGSSGSDSEESDTRLAVARPRFPMGFQPPPGLELPAPPGL